MIKNISGVAQYISEINKAISRFMDDVKELNRQLVEEFDDSHHGEIDHDAQEPPAGRFDSAEGQGRR